MAEAEAEVLEIFGHPGKTSPLQESTACIYIVIQKVLQLLRWLPLESPWPDRVALVARLASEVQQRDAWLDLTLAGPVALLEYRLMEMARDLNFELIQPREAIADWIRWAERLRDARIRRGESQKEAGKQCGVSDETYRKWESGRPPLERNIAAVLDYISSGHQKP